VGARQAALIVGLLFGLVHITGYPLITLPVKAAFGVLACLLYERTGSLIPGVALHSFVDASVTDLALTGNDIVVLIVAGTVTAVIVLRAGFLRFLRAPAPSEPAIQPAADSA
jgi:membrane protease YdiL (CAAX protease family)